MAFKLIVIGIIVALIAAVASSEVGGRIVDGEDAAIGQFPYQVSLRIAPNSHFCGGSIISPDWILTAGHCLEDLGQDFFVVVGATLLSDDGTRYDALISSAIVHEEYDYSTLANDIALVKMASSIEMTGNVGVIALQTEFIDEEADAVVSGWGLLIFDSNGAAPDHLQFLNTMTILIDDCKTKMEKFNSVSPNQICIFTKLDQGMCKGDSGGPLTANGKQIGVVSFGVPCGKGFPDVFTRVSAYIPWISDNSGLKFE